MSMPLHRRFSEAEPEDERRTTAAGSRSRGRRSGPSGSRRTRARSGSPDARNSSQSMRKLHAAEPLEAALRRDDDDDRRRRSSPRRRSRAHRTDGRRRRTQVSRERVRAAVVDARAPSSASTSTRARWSPKTTRSRLLDDGVRTRRRRHRRARVSSASSTSSRATRCTPGDRHRADRRVLTRARARLSSSTAAAARGTCRRRRARRGTGPRPTNHVVQRGWRWKSNHQSSPTTATMSPQRIAGRPRRRSPDRPLIVVAALPFGVPGSAGAAAAPGGSTSWPGR